MKQIKRVVSFLLTFCLLTVMTPAVQADGELTVSQEMVDVLKDMEGFYARPYWDYKQWTVGYGTRCPGAPESPDAPESSWSEVFRGYMQNGISKDAAEDLLREELIGFEANVHSFAQTHNLQLKQQEFDALVSFTYNLGPGWMNGGYMQRAVVSGARGSEFLYAITLYSKAGGEYILQDRRLCEANMYLNGVYRAYNSGADALPENYRYVLLDGNGGTVRYGICGYDAAEPTGIRVEFTNIPKGQKPDGTPYEYTIEGWYTAEGRKVELLDGTVDRNTVLYANWTDDTGKPVSLAKGISVSVEVTVTAETANICVGPAAFYPVEATAAKDTKLQLTEIHHGWGKTQQGWLKLADTDYTGVPVEARMGTVTGSKVNYRVGPSIGTQVAGQKFQGDRIKIVKIDYSQAPNWGMMEDGYWIRLDFVQLDDPNNPNQPTPPAQPNQPEVPVEDPVRKGDLTGDDKINSLDGLLLLRYLNGWNVEVQSPDAMDVNADGKVNSLDGLLLLRYLNGWDVSLQ